MAPVVAALRARADALRTTVCVTAQHREMLDQVLDLFGIVPDVDLGLMRAGADAGRDLRVHPHGRGRGAQGAPARRGARARRHDDGARRRRSRRSTARCPSAHVEAGLRSGRLDAPFPEELNRVVVDRLATHHFAPTPGAAENLRREGVDARSILVTGNTAIDALFTARGRLAHTDVPVRALARRAASALVLVTAHRREAFGKPFADVCAALQALALAHPDVAFVYPVHLNPQVRGPARERLTAPNVHLLEPVDYASLVWLLDRRRARAHRLGRHPGGGARARQARARAARRDRAPRADRGRRGACSWARTRSGSRPRPSRLLDDPVHRATRRAAPRALRRRPRGRPHRRAPRGRGRPAVGPHPRRPAGPGAPRPRPPDAGAAGAAGAPDRLARDAASGPGPRDERRRTRAPQRAAMSAIPRASVGRATAAPARTLWFFVPAYHEEENLPPLLDGPPRDDRRAGRTRPASRSPWSTTAAGTARGRAATSVPGHAA